jgi:phage-related minor tail protein
MKIALLKLPGWLIRLSARASALLTAGLLALPAGAQAPPASTRIELQTWPEPTPSRSAVEQAPWEQRQLRREQIRQQRELMRQQEEQIRQREEPLGQRALREQEKNRREQGRVAAEPDRSFSPSAPALGSGQPARPQRSDGR